MVTSDDMFSADVLADPHSYYLRLMREDPVHWDERYQTWIITKHADVMFVVRHPELFSSEFYVRDSVRPASPPIDESDAEQAAYVVQFRSRELIQNDPPVHARMRQPFNAYFSPKRMEIWRDLIGDSVASILDPIAARGEMDLRSDLGDVLPLLVICQLLGLPAEDRGLLWEQAERRMRSALSLAPDRMRVSAQGIAQSQEYLDHLIKKQAADGPAELMQILIGTEEGGAHSREEVLANALGLLDAGFETTTQLICNGTLALLRHPEQWQRLVADPAGLAASTTEECLRYDPPIPALRRIAAADVELGGKQIRSGDRVLFVVGSANRDPDVFPDPDRFDVSRSPNRHITFGSGIHVCLGQYLARMEGQAVFRALASRFPDLALASGEITYAELRGVRSIRSLPVTWSTTSPEAARSLTTSA